jgi:hypothetical protein
VLVVAGYCLWYGWWDCSGAIMLVVLVMGQCRWYSACVVDGETVLVYCACVVYGGTVQVLLYLLVIVG